MKMIDDRIATLTAEKEQVLADYPEADSEIQTMLAMQNVRIIMEIKFLNELNLALKEKV